MMLKPARVSLEQEQRHVAKNADVALLKLVGSLCSFVPGLHYS